MPMRPTAFCSAPGCSTRVRSGRCDAHARQLEQRRGSASARGYGRAWRKLREYTLTRDPLCHDCTSEGFIALAEHLHHPHKISDGGAVLTSNTIPLCARHHNIRTRRGE